MLAIAFLASKCVQEALEMLFIHATVSSLEVERWHAQAKRWVASKLTHLATASRNFFLQRYLRERCDDAEKINRARERLRRVKYHNVTSVVWEAQPQARPNNSQWASRVAPTQPQAQKAASDADAIIGATITDETRGKPRERKDAAVVALQELLQKHDMPMTRAQWRLWMSDHEGDFRELMKTAPT